MELTKEQKIAQQVITEAWSNPSFKEELIASPFEAIQKLTGQTITLPDGVDKLVVVDQTDPSCSYLNIPGPPDLDNIELTDAQLEAIAGGTPPVIPPPPPGIFDI